MKQPDVTQYSAEIDLFIYTLNRWQKIILELNSPAKTIKNISIRLVKLKKELLEFRQQNNYSYNYPNILDYRSQINELASDLEQLKLSVAQLGSCLDNIIALQEKLEVLQERQSLIPKPNYHYELTPEISLANISSKENKQYSFVEKILIFKLKYPENFWAGLIALVLGVTFMLKAADFGDQNFSSPTNPSPEISTSW